METLEEFLFKMIPPLVWLAGFAWVLTRCIIHLAKSWEEKNFKQIWLDTWILLLGVYLLVKGGN